MTLDEQYTLSFYQERAMIGNKPNIHLVQHTENGRFFVRKDLDIYNKDVYLAMIELQQNQTGLAYPTIYTCIEDQGHLIVIEEYIHGESLGEICEEGGRCTEQQVCNYMLQLCDALQTIHSMLPPIIHRDLKPSNVLITNEGTLKLIDINIAKPHKEEQTQDTMLMGTREYAAPEQYGFGQSDARTDIYSMGILMNFLLTGRYPREEIAEGRFYPIIKRCVEIDPTNRFSSALELKKAIQEMGANETYKAVKSAERKRYPYLPPGFRTLTIWKMIVAILGYVMIGWIVLTMEMSEKGVPLTGGKLVFERSWCFVMLILCVLIGGNYLDVMSHFPTVHWEKTKWRILWKTLYITAFVFIWIFIMVLIETFI